MKDTYDLILDKMAANYEESIRAKKDTLLNHANDIILSAQRIYDSIIDNSGRLFIFGNGGSAADSQHIAAEFTGRFQHERRPLPAIALTCNTSSLTAIGNDYSFDEVFSRPLQAMGQAGDIAWGISTSGNSKNVIKGIEKAKAMGLITITLTGHDGGQLGKIGDINIIAPSKSTARIQESHIFVYHLICELVEDFLMRYKELK